MNPKFVTKLAAFAVVSFACLQPAYSQWQWIDKDGKKVYSDRSPGAEIPTINILKQPGGKRVTQAASSVADGPATAASAPASETVKPAAASSAPKLSGKDTQLEAKKKQTEAEEATRKKDEEEKVAKARSENCERTKKAQLSLKSGVRIAVVNAKGERDFMDDAAKATEIKRLQSIADTDCAK